MGFSHGFSPNKTAMMSRYVLLEVLDLGPRASKGPWDVIIRWLFQILLGMFTPKKWANDPIWTVRRIFQNGWFNHQLDHHFGGGRFFFITAPFFQPGYRK